MTLCQSHEGVIVFLLFNLTWLGDSQDGVLLLTSKGSLVSFANKKVHYNFDLL